MSLRNFALSLLMVFVIGSVVLINIMTHEDSFRSELSEGEPTLIEEGYKGFNIILFGGKYYGLAQGEGAFDIDKFKKGEYKQCFCGDSVDKVRRIIVESLAHKAGTEQ